MGKRGRSKQLGVPRSLGEEIRTFNLHFIPASANVTVSGSMTYSSGQGKLTGPGGSAVDGSAAVTTSFDDLPNRSEYSALFDAFRIEHVKYRIIPNGDVQPNADDLGGATTVVASPQALETGIDLDDATPPSTIGEILQYETYKYTRPSDVCTLQYVPRVAREIFDGVTASFEEPEGSVWVDCAQQTTPHYGFKVWVTSHGASANVQNQWIIRGEMRISFKRTH